MKHRFAHERQAELRALLMEQGTVAVADLAKRWEVSEMTIRRDLAALEAEGAVARIHGGAVAGGRLRFGSRLERDRAGKERAAAKLADAIPERGCIYLDGSTTIYHLTAALVNRGSLIAATNNLDTFQALHRCPGIRPILIGGELNRDTDNLVGVHARAVIGQLAFDAAFFSAYALHPQLGPAEPVPDDAEIKRLVCQRAASIRLAVDHGKLGETAAACWAPDPARTWLATDLDPADPRLDAYRGAYATIL